MPLLLLLKLLLQFHSLLPRLRSPGSSPSLPPPSVLRSDGSCCLIGVVAGACGLVSSPVILYVGKGSARPEGSAPAISWGAVLWVFSGSRTGLLLKRVPSRWHASRLGRRSLGCLRLRYSQVSLRSTVSLWSRSTRLSLRCMVSWRPQGQEAWRMKSKPPRRAPQWGHSSFPLVHWACRTTGGTMWALCSRGGRESTREQ